MIEAEQAVLGCIIIEPTKVHEAISLGLGEEHFGSLANKRIWRSMKVLAHERIQIDPITLADNLSSVGSLDVVGGHSYISILDNALPDPASLAEYIKVIRGDALRRKVGQLGRSISNLPSRTFTNEQLLSEIHKQVSETANLVESGVRVRKAADLIEDLVSRMESDEPNNGIKSGYPILDMLLGGYRPGNLIVIAGRPGMGKTSFAMNQAHIQMTRYNKRVGFFSLEMSGEELIVKVLSAETGIPVSKIRVGALGDSEWERVRAAKSAISSFPLFIEDSGGLSTSQLAAKARELANSEGLDVIYVDYLQLMQSERRAGNRTEEVSQISRDLKTLAKELGIPIIAMSQLNRAVESRPDKRPQLSDLRESGSIEQDADSVMFVFRPGVYDAIDTTGGETELILAKNRSGPTGNIPLVWRAATNQFQSKD